MYPLLKKFELKQPEIVFQWNDRFSEAEGWLVINSLRGGAAGGGTRMREGLNKEEVVALAKTMEIKFTVSGPTIGGAKSGINFNPNDVRRKEVLKRWYKAVIPILKNYYGTGGDMNVDEILDVVPITESFGLWHPQEGIVKGHFNPSDKGKINKLGQLRTGVSKIIEDIRFTPSFEKGYTISDMVTGYGVAMSIAHFYEVWHRGTELKGKKAIIQGWGNVGASTGFFLSKMGVKIVAIMDKASGLINNEGFSHEEIIELFLNKEKGCLTHESLLSYEEMDDVIWHLPADIFIPAAGSRLVNEARLDSMINSGVELISSGANVPFDDPEIFYGNILSKADSKISVIPDFIANAGMARVFAYLMQENIELTDKAIFNDVSNIVKTALQKVYSQGKEVTHLTQKALKIAINELMN